MQEVIHKLRAHPPPAGTCSEQLLEDGSCMHHEVLDKICTGLKVCDTSPSGKVPWMIVGVSQISTPHHAQGFANASSGYCKA